MREKRQDQKVMQVIHWQSELWGFRLWLASGSREPCFGRRSGRARSIRFKFLFFLSAFPLRSFSQAPWRWFLGFKSLG